jgi:hypothetical protein
MRLFLKQVNGERVFGVIVMGSFGNLFSLVGSPLCIYLCSGGLIRGVFVSIFG